MNYMTSDNWSWHRDNVDENERSNTQHVNFFKIQYCIINHETDNMFGVALD